MKPSPRVRALVWQYVVAVSVARQKGCRLETAGFVPVVGVPRSVAALYGWYTVRESQ